MDGDPENEMSETLTNVLASQLLLATDMEGTRRASRSRAMSPVGCQGSNNRSPLVTANATVPTTHCNDVVVESGEESRCFNEKRNNNGMQGVQASLLTHLAF